MDTLALDYGNWDLDTDTRGNWRTVGSSTPRSDETGPGMRLAQDVATRCLSWRGEVYYDTTQGIRYETIMGEAPNMALLQSAYNTEALKVPECRTALVDFAFVGRDQRVLSGNLTVADFNGAAGTIQLT